MLLWFRCRILLAFPVLALLATCQRKSKACLGRKLLREDWIEEDIMAMLKRLVCPAPQVIDWVALAMRDQHATDIATRERLAASLQTQIDRLGRMDDSLYDDKLAVDITAERYRQKHDELMKQKTELERKHAEVDTDAGKALEQKLVLLELSQKAAELYPAKTPEQKRVIITSLFKGLRFGSDAVSVTYTNFSRALAQNVTLTHKLIGGAK